MQEMNSGRTMLDSNSKLLTSAFRNIWSHKLLCIVTEGPRNKNGPIQGLITKFEEATFLGVRKAW